MEEEEEEEEEKEEKQQQQQRQQQQQQPNNKNYKKLERNKDWLTTKDLIDVVGLWFDSQVGVE